MAWEVLIVSLLLVGLAMGAILLSRRWQRQSGLPPGEVIYTDSGAWHANAEPLFDSALRLAGKPDYLVEQADGSIIPVEVKSGLAPREPYPGHVLQLMAYCLLVEATYGTRPAHGILQYQDRAFAVDYTWQLEQDLLEALDDMRADRDAADVRRDHDDGRRCRACGFRERCADSLA
jgi:CRISPR-associated exonuclease Cas4